MNRNKLLSGNVFTDSNKHLHELYIAMQKERFEALNSELLETYTNPEIDAQLQVRNGPAYDRVTKINEEFAKKTEHVEFVTALGLSAFYFGIGTPTEISFVMKPGFKGGKGLKFNSLISNIESSTHVDCAISDGKTGYLFQIKRYPQKYLKHENGDFLTWLQNKVFRHYSDMKGVKLVAILQPANSTIPTAFDFTTLSSSIKTLKDNKFDEVLITFTELSKAGTLSVLHTLWPTNSRKEIETSLVLDLFRNGI